VGEDRRAASGEGAVLRTAEDVSVTVVEEAGGSRLPAFVTRAVPRLADDRAGLPSLGEMATPVREAFGSGGGGLRRFLVFLVFAALPLLLGVIFYTSVAADRYATEVRFAIKSSETRQSDMLSALAGLPGAGGGGGIQESYLVVAYLTSRQAVEALDRNLDIRAMYSRPEADFLYRLKREATIEELVDYWTHRLSAVVDLQSNTITLEVQAFTAEDARRIAEELLKLAESLVNDINTRARQDAVRFADEQLVRAEARLEAARKALREFRDQQAELDPGKTADAMLNTITSLNGEKLRLEQELALRRRSLQQTSPIIVDLNGRIAKLQEQIDHIKASITDRGQKSEAGTLSSQIGRYDQLQTEQEFARKLYENALASLEQARAAANKQQLFIVPFVKPAAAERAKYPDRPISILTVFIASMALWMTVMLIGLGVRDHPT
jgi:capsular polysaccharide transport system permease protein